MKYTVYIYNFVSLLAQSGVLPAAATTASLSVPLLWFALNVIFWQRRLPGAESSVYFTPTEKHSPCRDL